MSVVSPRRRARVARAGAASGSGPTSAADHERAWPGSDQKFALFGEVLVTGVIVTLLSLPLITVPVALVAGHRHLMRFLKAEGSSLSLVWADVRASLLGGIAVGLGWLVLTLVLVLDISLVLSGSLTGGIAVGVVVGILCALAAAWLVRGASRWSPATGWAPAIRSGLLLLRSDLRGTAYLVTAIALVVLFTWMLPPLVLPSLGCLCFASAVVAGRVPAA